MVERFSYRGWNNAYKLSNGSVELIVTADVGPRILNVSMNFEEPKSESAFALALRSRVFNHIIYFESSLHFFLPLVPFGIGR